MADYDLAVDVPSKGCYLSHTQIQLLSIVQCKSEAELKEFVTTFMPNFGGKIDFSNEYVAEKSKRQVFDTFVHSLVSVEEQERDGFSVIAKQLELLGISKEDIEEIRASSTYTNEIGNVKLNIALALSQIKQILADKYPGKDFEEFIKEGYFSRVSDFENLKSVRAEKDDKTGKDVTVDRSITYDEIAILNTQLADFDLILISSGKFIDTVCSHIGENMEGMEADEFSQRFCDFSGVKYDLDFAKRNSKHVRYHSLLTQDTQPRMQGKSREEILQWFRLYMQTSVDFISDYNAKNKLADNSNVISSVDLLNELVELNKPPYENIWSKMGISLEDICDILCGMEKPDGVKYLYNETFVETPFRKDEQSPYEFKHQAIYENLKLMMEKYPGLIDSFGTQVHIDAYSKIEDLEITFNELRKWQQEFEIGMQITEFDVHMPSQIIEKMIQMIKSGSSKAEMFAMAKAKKIGTVNATKTAIEQSEIELEATSYWTLLNKADPHLVMALQSYIREGKPIEGLLDYSLFGGKYSEINEAEKRIVPGNEIQNFSQSNRKSDFAPGE